MEDCIFCKVIEKEIPSTKVWEDEKHYAFFDLFPNCKWQTLIITKKHYDSQIFEMWDTEYSELLLASKKVAERLKKAFQVERVGVIIEWMGVNHVHVKLYPMHGLSEQWTPNVEAKSCYFSEYPGYLTSIQWEMLSPAMMQELETIINN